MPTLAERLRRFALIIVPVRCLLPRTIVDVDRISLVDGDEVVEQVLDVLEDFQALEDAVEDGYSRLRVLWPRLSGAGAHATDPLFGKSALFIFSYSGNVFANTQKGKVFMNAQKGNPPAI